MKPDDPLPASTYQKSIGRWRRCAYRQRRRPSSQAVLSLHLIMCLFVANFAPFLPAGASYVSVVPPKDEVCFDIRTSPGKSGTLHGNYDHLDDELSSDPVSVVVIDDDEQHVLYRSRRRSSEGTFTIQLKPDQKVNLCIQNGILSAGRGRKSASERPHDGHSRAVGFTFSVEARNEALELESQNAKIVQAAKDLARDLGNLHNHHEYMRTREARHREVVETTFSQLLTWVILEGVMVILIAGGQILYFRRFLERRRYM